MTTISTEQNEPCVGGTEQAFPVLKWQVRLYEEAPTKRWAILGTALISAAAGWLLFHNIMLPIIAIIAIFGSTTEFWLPISYVLDDREASARCGISASAIEWSNVKRAMIFENLVKLTPTDRDTRLAEFRGVVFRFGDKREEILEAIRRKLGEECLISGTKS